MLSLQPISAFAISEFDPDLDDPTIIRIADDALQPDAHWIFTVAITPFQPGVNIVFPDSDVAVEVSWVQFELPV